MPLSLRSAVAVAALSWSLSGCASQPAGNTPYQPTADMAAVLAAQAQLGAKPIEDLTPDQARVNPSVADAVRAVQAQRGQPTAPMPVANVKDIQVTGTTGPIPA